MVNEEPISKVCFHDIGGFTLFGLIQDDSFECSMPLWAYELCYEWMIDVNGLLDDNLSIEIEEK